MNNSDPLAELRDIHLPVEPGWWPLAPGWWIVAALVLSAIAVVLWWWWRGRQRRRLLKAALTQLQDIAARHAQDADGRLFLTELSQLMRRWIQAQGQGSGVGLSGRQWQQFLNDSMPDQSAGEFWRQLTYAPYQAQPVQVDLDASVRMVRQWLKARAT